MRYHWAVATHRGRVRTSNEDASLPTTAGRSDGPVVVMVADGMGGHIAGEIASQVAVEAAAAAAGGTPAERVLAGNRAILAEVAQRPELAGMGTTMTLMELIPEGSARLAHIGDSRAYLLRDGELRQLTVDHTVVNEYLLAGRISRAEAATHPQRSILTRALGLTYEVDVDTADLELRPGDRLLLCSDGVNAMIDDDLIAAGLAMPTPEEAVWELVELANRAGGHDNITALVVDAER